MIQNALKKEIAEQTEPHVSEALSSIRDTIKSNLEQGLDNFKDPQNEIKLQEALTMKSTDQPQADVFFLTDVLEADGSITTLEKKEKTGMSDTQTQEKTEAPAPAPAEAAPTETPETTVDSAETTPPEPAQETAAAVDFSANTPAEPSADLASKETMAESAAAFSELADVARQLSSAPQTSGVEPVQAQNAGNYTVDALMRELLRPMLKEWLDAHLPSLVKWLVTEQIEKMLKDQLGVIPTPAASSTPENSADPAPMTEEPAPDTTEGEATDPTADMDFDTPAAS